MQFAVIFTFLTTILGPLVTKVLTGLGIGAVTYAGISILLSEVKSQLISQFGNIDSATLMLLGLAKVDVCINIILSAVTARAIVAGMSKTSGSIKKLGSVGK